MYHSMSDDALAKNHLCAEEKNEKTILLYFIIWYIYEEKVKNLICFSYNLILR